MGTDAKPNGLEKKTELRKKNARKLSKKKDRKNTTPQKSRICNKENR